MPKLSKIVRLHTTVTAGLKSKTRQWHATRTYAISHFYTGIMMSDQRLSGSINKLILYSIAWLGDIVRLLIQGVHLLPK